MPSLTSRARFLCTLFSIDIVLFFLFSAGCLRALLIARLSPIQPCTVSFCSFLNSSYVFSFSAGLSPRSSRDTSLTSRASSAEGAPAHLTAFSPKRMDREFERKLQEVFVSIQLEKVRKLSASPFFYSLPPPPILKFQSENIAI